MNSTSTPKATKRTNFPSAEAAIYYVEDVLGRAGVPFFLLGKTARQIVDNSDVPTDVPVTVGVKRRHMTNFARRTLKMMLPPDAKITDTQISFTQSDTPVRISIIDRNFKVLHRPDTVWYRLTHFQVPNPFKDYWKTRNLVR